MRCRDTLVNMVRTVNVRDSVTIVMDTVSDMAYAWQCITDYVEEMQARVKRDPSCVVLLRAVFLKLTSVLDSPLVRISQVRRAAVDRRRPPVHARVGRIIASCQPCGAHGGGCCFGRRLRVQHRRTAPIRSAWRSSTRLRWWPLCGGSWRSCPSPCSAS